MPALLGALLLGGVMVHATPSAPEGVIETGVPSFAVLGPEALGLSSSPLDLNLLPDGRVLVASQRELTFGDGVRWETYRAADNQPTIFASVAVDRDGRLYAGMAGGFGRIVMNEQARWQFEMAMPLPLLPIASDTTLVSVAAFGDQWYWYGGNGTVVSWQPGQQPRHAGDVGAIRRIFTLGEEVFVSDEASGGLRRLKPDATTELVGTAETLVSECVTCAIPYKPGELLVGSAGAGLKLFDGKSFRSFGSTELLRTRHRITDICAAGDGYFAVAIDTVGIVFFDRDGHTIQVLDRKLDHRLGRVQRLQYAANGVLWALLNDGLARVEFPSATSVSNFEPLIDSGLTFAQPLRHAGVLWVFADGRAMRGLYDEDEQLVGFTDDTPPGRYLYTLTEVDGCLFAGNEEGIYVYASSGWKLVLAGIVNARVGAARGRKGEFAYVARGEYGVIRQTGDDFSVQRIPAPALGDSYNARIDANGTGWIELGVSSVGRMELRDGIPVFRIFGPQDGLTSGWLEAYVLDGIARFHLTSHVYRFDEARGKFVEDRELLDLVPDLANAVGRPIIDDRRRLWYTIDGAPHVVDLGLDSTGRTVDIRPVGFAPTSYTLEDNGVIWMFAPRRLSRMDPRIARPIPKAPEALITSVQLTSSDRQLFTPGPTLGALTHEDNSVVIHFAAPTNPFASPVTFEVMLEGTDNRWTSTGSVGTASFNRLKEGDYVFRVRPVAGGTIPGAEARLTFSVRPPWYRTPIAWAAYGVGVIGLFISVIWITSYLQRRENERLEQLVTARTGELHHTNAELSRQIAATTEKTAALATSEERYRQLSIELEARVKTRTEELSLSNKELSWKTALFLAQADSSPDGVLIVNAEGKKIFRNQRTTELWKIPPEIAGDDDDEKQIQFVANRTKHPEQFVERVRHLYSHPDESSREEIEFKDGMVLERYSAPIIGKDGTRYGRIWAFRDITARKQSEAELEKAHRELLGVSRQAGMAEVSTAVLHNVGNVLNTVNLGVHGMRERLERARFGHLRQAVALLEMEKPHLAQFLTEDPRGQALPGFLNQLAGYFETENRALLEEVVRLIGKVDHIKEIVSTQQSHARIIGVTEQVNVAELAEDAIRIAHDGLIRHRIILQRDFQSTAPVVVDRHKVVQILVNLLNNGKDAITDSGSVDRRIDLRVAPAGDARVSISVIDSGAGIAPENLPRIFRHGFTTKADGHGFGLHMSALAAQEMRGALRVHSDGIGRGATFTLELPVSTPVPVS